MIYIPETGRWTRLVARGGQLAGDEPGYIDCDGYRRIMIDGTVYYSSSLAWLYMRGYFSRRQIDHADCDPANDVFDNLRRATLSQQQANKRLLSCNSSGFRGAFLDKRSGKYRARISVDGQRRHLGTYPSAPEAHLAWWVAAREAWGEFVRLR